VFIRAALIAWAVFAPTASFGGDLFSRDDFFQGGRLFLQEPAAIPPHDAPQIDSLPALGEKLFFDPILSGSGRTSCATCHDPNYAFAQPLRTSVFDSGQPGPRNAPSILTARYLPRLMWDGRIASLEAQVFAPIRRDGEMGIAIDEAAERLAADPVYSRLFVRILNQPPSPQGIAAALAAFERTLVTGWSRFDRFSLKGDERALSGFERFGFDVFRGKAGCAVCHPVPDPGAKNFGLFTDFAFHNLGVGFYRGGFPDRGLAAITGRKEHIGAFRTPPLRNVAVTAPYMHDGSLPTLRAVVEFYNAGGQPNPYITPVLHPLGLSDEEKDALVAFLNTLTTEDFGQHGPGARPAEAFLAPRH
jgi:cytochrome c peroxidase